MRTGMFFASIWSMHRWHTGTGSDTCSWYTLTGLWQFVQHQFPIMRRIRYHSSYSWSSKESHRRFCNEFVCPLIWSKHYTWNRSLRLHNENEGRSRAAIASTLQRIATPMKNTPWDCKETHRSGVFFFFFPAYLWSSVFANICRKTQRHFHLGIVNEYIVFQNILHTAGRVRSFASGRGNERRWTLPVTNKLLRCCRRKSSAGKPVRRFSLRSRYSSIKRIAAKGWDQSISKCGEGNRTDLWRNFYNLICTQRQVVEIRQ